MICVLFGVSSSNELGLGLVIPGIVSAAIYVSSSFLKFTYFNIRFEPPSQNPVFCSCICGYKYRIAGPSVSRAAFVSLTFLTKGTSMGSGPALNYLLYIEKVSTLPVQDFSFRKFRFNARLSILKTF